MRLSSSKFLLLLLLLLAQHTRLEASPPAISFSDTQSFSSIVNGPITLAPESVEEVSASFFGGTGQFILDVDLFVNISHPDNGNLDLFLVSPDGTEVPLVTKIDQLNNFRNIFAGTLFDDQALTPATFALYQDNVVAPALVPEGSLGAFSYKVDFTGEWTLRIKNHSQSAGTLHSFSVTITAFPESPLPAQENLDFGSTPDLPIPDADVTSDTITVSQGLIEEVCNISVVVDIPHPYSGDLVIRLTSPEGTTVLLSNRNGGSVQDAFVNLRFSDADGVSARNISDFDFIQAAEPPASLGPDAALSAFIGESSSGDWTLEITDEGLGDTGTLRFWVLSLVLCAPDQDEDRVQDSLDNCPAVFNPLQEDSDGDGQADACESCPSDANKIEPGACGCGLPDIDSDGDQTLDCNDVCENDPDKIDVGVCGCGAPDVDQDNSGIMDCLFSAETKNSVDTLITDLNGIKFKKKRKAKKAIRKNIKSILFTVDTLLSYIQQNDTAIFEASTLDVDETNKLMSRLKKQLRSLRKRVGKTKREFNRTKKQGLRLLSRIQSEL